MGETIINGGDWAIGISSNGWSPSAYTVPFYSFKTTNINVSYCDKLCALGYSDYGVSGKYINIPCIGAYNNYWYIRVPKNELVTEDVAGLKIWLKDNPLKVAYKLTKPYYELIKPNVGLLNAEQGLYLNISDSVVPVVNHQDLCTLKLNHYFIPSFYYI